MRTITIRELHLCTGKWVRQAAAAPVIVTERGRAVATIMPFDPAHRGTPFGKRRLVRGFAELPAIAGDVTETISADRGGRT